MFVCVQSTESIRERGTLPTMYNCSVCGSTGGKTRWTTTIFCMNFMPRHSPFRGNPQKPEHNICSSSTNRALPLTFIQNCKLTESFFHSKPVPGDKFTNPQGCSRVHRTTDPGHAKHHPLVFEPVWHGAPRFATGTGQSPTQAGTGQPQK